MPVFYNPEVFQGAHRHRRYFEGWYYKLISRDRTHALALIPGIALGEGGEEAHAFLQVIDASTCRTAYFRYPLSAFSGDRHRLSVRVGENHFSREGLMVAHTDDTGSLHGVLSFSDQVPYPKTRLHRGIMGPYTYVPFMECRHDIVTLRQTLHGQLWWDGEPLDFEGGEGYVEKDWGRSFPSDWIWLQANHFSDSDASFLFSVAEIPFMGSRFTGLLCFLQTADETVRLATYTRARAVSLIVEKDHIHAVIRQPAALLSSRPALQLEMDARFVPGGQLRAPKNGLMERTIEESIAATVSVCLTDKSGNRLFDGVSDRTGMEISEGARCFDTTSQ